MFEYLKVGDTVKVCILGSRNQKLCFDTAITNVTDVIELKFVVDVSRLLKFDRNTGKLVNSDAYWLEKT